MASKAWGMSSAGSVVRIPFGTDLNSSGWSRISLTDRRPEPCDLVPLPEACGVP